MSGAVFRESIFMGLCPFFICNIDNLGTCALTSRRQLHELVMRLSLKGYQPNDYHYLKHNCNSFCHELCLILTGNTPPSWLNRMVFL